MISSYSQKDIEQVIDRLRKLRSRTRGKRILWPANNCSDIDTHLCGMFLREHLDLFLETLRSAE